MIFIEKSQRAFPLERISEDAYLRLLTLGDVPRIILISKYVFYRCGVNDYQTKMGFKRSWPGERSLVERSGLAQVLHRFGADKGHWDQTINVLPPVLS